jgi:hypothetical protein
MTDTIDTVNRGGTLYYSFRSNPDGAGRAKEELRYARDLWTHAAQLRIRIPLVTRYPLAGNPRSGLGKIELGYSYNVTSPAFDHSLEFRVALPTESNHVTNDSTQLKAFYVTKWKWTGGSIAYSNELDQTVIKPPGSSWTSYYEGKLALPDYAFVHALRGLKVSALYIYRVLFGEGSEVRDAAGGTLYGNLNAVALSVTDTWGLGGHPLWRYRFEANATASF